MHKLIRSRMDALGLETAADLYARMELPPSGQTVRAWVRGTTTVTPEWWPCLAAALGVTVDALSEADRLDRLGRAGGGQ